MADLIKDSYVFGGGVKLQAQYENAGPQAPDRPVSNTDLKFTKESGWFVCRDVGRIDGISVLELWVKDQSSPTQVKIKANGARSGTKFSFVEYPYGPGLSMGDGFTYNLVNGMGSPISHRSGVTIDNIDGLVLTLRNNGSITTTIS